MAMFGLTWNPDFMRSRAGMTMVAQVIVGAAGGVLSLLPIPLIGGNSYESFIFWTSFFISGFFLLTHMTNLTQSLESKVPQLRNIHLLYLAAWSVMIVIAVIYRFVVWNLISICLWAHLIAFLVDLFFKYRGSPSPPTQQQQQTPETAEAGGAGKF